MPSITQISGSQASYANLAAQTGLTYVATTNVPPGSAATGVLRSAENAAASLRVDPLASVAPSAGDHYWLRLWVRGLRGAGAAPASKLDYGLFAWDGTRFLTFKFQTNSDATLGWTPLRGDASIAGGASDSIMFDAGPEPVIAWGDWCQLVLHVERHATTGKWRLFVNGVLFAYKTGINTDQLWTTGLNANSFLFALPAWVGAYWEMCGPIESWSATDIEISSQWGLDNPAADRPTPLATKIFLPFATAQAGALVQGCHGQVSGTGTVTVDSEYLNQSGSPCRHRLIFAGDGSTPTWTTIEKVGTLPFNEQGWATLVLSDLLVPTTSSNKGFATWRINKDDGNPLFQFQAGNGSIFVAYESDAYLNVGNWTPATARYAVLLHLNRDGRASFTTIDLSSQPGSGSGNVSITTSGRLPDWTVQPLGTMALSAIPNGANNIEVGFLGVFRRPTLFALDSLAAAAHTPASGNTTPINNATCIARSFPMQRECQSLPGAHWPLKQLGLERRVLVAPLGRSGLARRDFTRNVLAPLLHTQGCEVLSIEGAINDVALILTGADRAVLAEVANNFDALLAWAVARDNAVWASTILPRDLRTLTITAVTAANPAVITAAAHGLPIGGTLQIDVSGVVGTGNITAANAFVFNAVVVDANTIRLTGIDTSGGTYTSGGTARGYPTQQLAAIAKLNDLQRAALARRQRQALLTLSDLATDTLVNPATYPNNTTFWADFTHPATGGGAAGANVAAGRMVQIRLQPPTPLARRRWPRRLLARS
ncbi:MAG: hypothetical protein K2Y37_06750 [Pirellulales bacterium]|nr:hypothetical protein [Pirellulales bacterium]